uniref:CHASE2 domain-containing protein n=1 Tax=Desertifilum tharense IPPAS B-1220 TaxID=1781255 RepID=A0ACD5H2Z4_9CYAN
MARPVKLCGIRGDRNSASFTVSFSSAEPQAVQLNAKKLYAKIWQRRALWITAPAIATLAIGTSSLGLLQILDWAVLDQFFRWRHEPADPRIAIVTIDEFDVVKLQQWYDFGCSFGSTDYPVTSSRTQSHWTRYFPRLTRRTGS